MIWLYFGFIFIPVIMIFLKLKNKEYKSDDDLKTIALCIARIIGFSILWYYMDWYTFDHDGPLLNEIMIWKK